MFSGLAAWKHLLLTASLKGNLVMGEIEQLQQSALQAIQNTDNLEDLEAIRVQYLGKKGELTSYLKQLGSLSPEDKKKLGQQLNHVKQIVQTAIGNRKDVLQQKALEEQIERETIDITLPGRRQPLGTVHPVTHVQTDIQAIFASLGYTFEDGPEVESDYYNFTALNIPEHHPARAMHDTFYTDDHQVLRTHVSPVQVRVMEQTSPPISMIAMGRVYRHDFDLTHTPMFHQCEGLVVDKNINFAHLKGTIEYFIQTFFGRSLAVRFRPSFFPFTEPSAEADMQCIQCQGKGCRVCEHSGWLEILGCGMVHPNVLSYSGLDPKEYSGFAFGIGIDRLAMLRYAIDDLRVLFDNDSRFLEQFKQG